MTPDQARKKAALDGQIDWEALVVEKDGSFWVVDWPQGAVRCEVHECWARSLMVEDDERSGALRYAERWILTRRFTLGAEKICSLPAA